MSQILSSWKEIASFFGKGVRTVQRWEHNLGLPVHRPEGASQNIVLAHPDELSAWLNAGHKHAMKTVLLVEADPTQRTFIESFLSLSGYDVTACQGAEEAMTKLNELERLDLLLTGLDIPGMDGMDLVRRICEARQQLSAIVMSTDTARIESLRQDKSSRCEFLCKPFNFTELQKTIDLCLGDSSQTSVRRVLHFPSENASGLRTAQAS
ncbi:response regulator [Terriglobus albidus]|uniref:response regulator n=1 Tax=Terriglobus albidus TaxID=1592106 RepID=UPI0021DFF88B|nr:response regulator [Terriglobus albidus]